MESLIFPGDVEAGSSVVGLVLVSLLVPGDVEAEPALVGTLGVLVESLLVLGDVGAGPESVSSGLSVSGFVVPVDDDILMVYVW